MATPEELLTQAANEAVAATQIATEWANKPVGWFSATESGPLPSIKEFNQQQAVKFEQAISNTGWFPTDGSFEAGGTITERNQYLQLITTVGADVAGGYSWGGVLPKTVTAGSTPETSGGISPNAWVYRSDTTLRSALAAPDSTVLVGGSEANSINDSKTISDYRAKVAGLVSTSSAKVVILGDSTECGVGISGSTSYGECNSFTNDGWGHSFAYSLIRADSRFKLPPKISPYYKDGINQTGLGAPFPNLQLIVTETPYEGFQVVNNGNVLTNNLVIYHNRRTADTAARFRVRAYNTSGTLLADQIIDTYVPQVTYAGVGRNVQNQLTTTLVTLSSTTRVVNIVISDVDVIDRGAGVAADGTALYFGCTLGQGVKYDNLAVSSTTLKNDSADNILRGITTEERVELAVSKTPNIIFIGWGTNDSKVGVSDVATFTLEYEALIDNLRSRLNNPNIILITDPEGSGIYENNSVYNSAIRKVASRKRCLLLDIESVFKILPPAVYSDDVHPSSFGYGAIAESAINLLHSVQVYPESLELKRQLVRSNLRKVVTSVTPSSDSSGDFVLIQGYSLLLPPGTREVEVDVRVFAAEFGDILNQEYELRISNPAEAGEVVIDSTIIRVGAADGEAYSANPMYGLYSPNYHIISSAGTILIRLYGKNYRIKSAGVNNKMIVNCLG